MRGDYCPIMKTITWNVHHKTALRMTTSSGIYSNKANYITWWVFLIFNCKHFFSFWQAFTETLLVVCFSVGNSRALFFHILNLYLGSRGCYGSQKNPNQKRLVTNFFFSSVIPISTRKELSRFLRPLDLHQPFSTYFNSLSTGTICSIRTSLNYSFFHECFSKYQTWSGI